jgi:Ca2+-binding EF-hand superfamily protein
MSVREVKSIMQAFNVDSTGCIEKGEMVQKLRNSGHVRWVAD